MHKKLSDLRIVFLGTPDFAVATLEALIQHGANIVGVVTAPEKAAGRGLALQQSAVKKYALDNQLHLLQPEKLKDENFIKELKALQADLQVVVAFRMLPEAVWKMPTMGTINLHASLLPLYRGAAPINWAIINGEIETGLTTFTLQHAIDTGDILLQETIAIYENETAGELHDRMKIAGAVLMVKTLNELTAGSLQKKPQPLNTNEIKHAPKINTGTCKIDWTKTTLEVYNLIRGLSPYPAAFTFLDGKQLKIYKSEKHVGQVNSAPGAFNTDKKTYLYFNCSDGFIAVQELQLQGKKKMSVQDFLRGYRF
ncbi:MAG: methionyl-tRNA formyltransferase [Ferruginibacter sp.]